MPFSVYYPSLLRQTHKSKEKPGQICLTRSSASPGSSLICLTKYGEISWAATFFCWKWQNWDFAIAITFYPVIRTLWNFLCIIFGSCSTQILNFNAKKIFLDMLKIVRKSGFDPIVAYFRTIIYIYYLTLPFPPGLKILFYDISYNSDRPTDKSVLCIATVYCMSGTPE